MKKIKYLWPIVLVLNFHAALAQSDNAKFTAVGFVSAGLPTSSYGKDNFKNSLGINVNLLGRLSESFKIGGDVGYNYFSAEKATFASLYLFNGSFIARWYPAALVGNLLNEDFSANRIYLEGGIGHAFNSGILSDILLNYNHVKVGSHSGNFDFGLSSAAYGISKQPANGGLTILNICLGYRF